MNQVCPGTYNGATTVPCYLPGRYLGIVRKGTNDHLSMCEIEAYEV